MNKRFIIFLFCSFASSAIQSLFAQVPSGRYRNLEALIESIAETLEEGEEYTSWLEELQELHNNPLNINTCDREDLLKIPFLNEITAAQIIDYRKRYGPFLTVFEVSSVPGIGSDLAEKISFFIVTGDEDHTTAPGSSGKKWTDHDLLIRGWKTFPAASGYSGNEEKPPAYLGNPGKIYSRYSFENSSGWHAGITADKDPGEQFFRGDNKYGFDFYSAHLAFTTKQKTSRVIIGDFTARSGQGLVLWQGFSTGKSADVMQASKNMSQIRPYTSSDENFFFRGIATTLEIKGNRINLFLSSKKSDANILADDSVTTITSLETSGYHRTISETEDKKSVRHTVTGIIYNLSGNNYKIGITSLYEKLQYPLIPGDQLYEKFHFSGKENFNIGVDYRWVKGRFQLYGEGAVSKSSGMAWLQGLEARLHDQVNLVFMVRHFDRNYHATWANVFANNARATNETGIYSGLMILPASGIVLAGYVDWFKSPWIRYSTASPSSGYDCFLQADFRFSRNLSAYVRLKEKNRELKIKGDNLYINANEEHQYFRAQVKYDADKQLSFQTRVEANRMTMPEEEYGWLVYQDIAFSPAKVPVSAVLRLAWFDTGSYNTRIYVYENDLLYAFSTPSFYGKGLRTYLNFRFHLMKKLEGWLKIAGTSYYGQENSGSGYDEINGNIKSEFKIQFRYRF